MHHDFEAVLSTSMVASTRSLRMVRSTDPRTVPLDALSTSSLADSPSRLSGNVTRLLHFRLSSYFRAIRTGPVAALDDRKKVCRLLSAAAAWHSVRDAFLWVALQASPRELCVLGNIPTNPRRRQQYHFVLAFCRRTETCVPLSLVGRSVYCRCEGPTR